MPKEINSEILIQANPEKIWKILTDFAQYPYWNPFIKSITGAVQVGNKITVRLEPPGAMGMTIKPQVKAFVPQQEFRWLGHLFIKGLFDGEHKFELIDHGNGSTTFKHSERFNGILIPLFKKLLDVNTKNGFEAMNQKLKELSESA
jgi:hypothetical protein